MSTQVIRETILVVDDEKDFNKLICEVLRHAGYITLSTDNIKEGLALLKQKKVDLVVTDLNFPEGSGIEILEEVLNREANQIPCIMLTGDQEVEMAVSCMKKGAYGYLQKPMQPQNLLKTIKRAIDEFAVNKALNKSTKLLKGDIFAGYRVKKFIAEGSMGVVYEVEATDRVDIGEKGKVYALKLLRIMEDQDSDMEDLLRKRFITEAKATMRISHPNVVALFDMGMDTERNLPYIVMEYLEGDTLSLLIDRDQLTMEEKCKILKQISLALKSIHDCKITHRDIKPSNIIVTPEGRAVLTDFGIAHLHGSNLTMTNEVFGTPAYLSPEAFYSAKVGPESDIFSFGVVCYETLLGYRPFDGGSIQSIARQIQNEAPAHPCNENKQIPDLLGSTLMRMLEKRPERRFKSTTKISEAFQKCLDEGLESKDGIMDWIKKTVTIRRF
ncbi:MAG: protein kinase [Lentisphaeria bacterium]|nr:protein kinase [Lentisphaeria bacterium]